MNKQERQIKVGELWAKNKPNKEIAKELDISVETVKADIKELIDIGKKLDQEVNSKTNPKILWGIGLIFLSIFVIYLMPTSVTVTHPIADFLGIDYFNDEDNLKVNEISHKKY